MAGGVLNTYRELLPLTSKTPMITMGEGDTPLVKSNRLGRELGCPELYFKLEGCNPTGSFKDRGMVLAIAKALEEGTRAIMCASTGNTSASAAAFGAFCDLPTFVLIPKGEVAMGKLAQAMIYGAKVIMVNGNFDVALGLVREFTERNDVTLVNSVNLNRIEGQKTAAFELVDALGDAPDLLFIPVGNAGNITAYWQGYVEYFQAERAASRPRLFGFQAKGAAPIVKGERVDQPETIATAIRIGNPASWEGALLARDESDGRISAVSDEQILAAYQALARDEGIFCEPASAASVAGLKLLRAQGVIESREQVVCILTGHQLKDPNCTVSYHMDTQGEFSNRPVEVANDLDAVIAEIQK